MSLGAILFALGLLLYWAPALAPWLGRLPGDLRLERGGLRIYVPLTSCLLLSALLSAAAYLWSRLR